MPTITNPSQIRKAKPVPANRYHFQPKNPKSTKAAPVSFPAIFIYSKIIYTKIFIRTLNAKTK